DVELRGGRTQLADRLQTFYRRTTVHDQSNAPHRRGPRVTDVRFELLQQRQRRLAAVRTEIAQAAGDRRRARERRRFGEKAADLHVRIRAELEPPEQFQDEYIAIANGRVTLLAAHRSDRFQMFATHVVPDVCGAEDESPTVFGGQRVAVKALQH